MVESEERDDNSLNQNWSMTNGHQKIKNKTK